MAENETRFSLVVLGVVAIVAIAGLVLLFQSETKTGQIVAKYTPCYHIAYTYEKLGCCVDYPPENCKKIAEAYNKMCATSGVAACSLVAG